MPYEISDLVPADQKLIVVQPSQSATKALELMVHHDFTQLPVVSVTGELTGLVSHGPILTSTAHLGCAFGVLRVHDALVMVPSIKPGEVHRRFRRITQNRHCCSRRCQEKGSWSYHQLRRNRALPPTCPGYDAG
jgi:CBS domain-containing protein